MFFQHLLVIIVLYQLQHQWHFQLILLQLRQDVVLLLQQQFDLQYDRVKAELSHALFFF